MDRIEWSERPALKSPLVVCAFKGWNDAGEAATAALGFLIDTFDASEVARLDPAEYYDLTAVRPTARRGGLHHECAKAGIASVSLWASVPRYVAAAPNPKAGLALIGSFEGVAGVAVEALDLEESAADYERQVSAAVGSDPEVKSFVERLEQTLDEAQPDMPPERIPSADSIARDFQRFLRQRGPE